MHDRSAWAISASSYPAYYILHDSSISRDPHLLTSTSTRNARRSSRTRRWRQYGRDFRTTKKSYASYTTYRSTPSRVSGGSAREVPRALQMKAIDGGGSTRGNTPSTTNESHPWSREECGERDGQLDAAWSDSRDVNISFEAIATVSSGRGSYA